MNGSPVVGLVRGWVGLYTRGLPPEPRAARRDEVDDDLWCEHEEAAALGRSARSLDANLLLRLLFGMPADISWRLAYGGHAPAARLARSPAMSTSILGVLAVVAGSSPGFLLILSGLFGDAMWTWGGTVVLLVLGAMAFLAAALGLAWRFQDRVSLLSVAGALLAAWGAFLIIAGGHPLIVTLPVGSAMLMWDLARIGVVPWLLAIAHAASVIGLAVALVGVTFLAPLGILYPVTWVAIGVSLVRGVPVPRATGA